MVRALDAAGVKVSEISVRSASLDDVFLTLTGHVAEDKDDLADQEAEKAAKTQPTAQQTEREAVR